MNALAAVVQVVDFLYKAIIAYAKTPEGEKELADVARALGVDNESGDITLSDVDTTLETTQSTSGRIIRPNNGG